MPRGALILCHGRTLWSRGPRGKNPDALESKLNYHAAKKIYIGGEVRPPIRDIRLMSLGAREPERGEAEVLGRP